SKTRRNASARRSDRGARHGGRQGDHEAGHQGAEGGLDHARASIGRAQPGWAGRRPAGRARPSSGGRPATEPQEAPRRDRARLTASGDTAWSMSEENLEMVRKHIEARAAKDAAGAASFFDPHRAGGPRSRLVLGVAPVWSYIVAPGSLTAAP